MRIFKFYAQHATNKIVLSEGGGRVSHALHSIMSASWVTLDAVHESTRLDLKANVVKI